jgi:hypothetical protein
MKPHILYVPALLVAMLCAGLVALGPLAEATRTLFPPLTLVAAATAAALFVRWVLDPRCRRGIAAANRELQGDQPFRPRRRLRLLDPEWGLMGSRVGGRALLVVRAVLMFEFTLALLVSGQAHHEVLILAAAGFAVTIMLSLLHVGLNTAEEAR